MLDERDTPYVVTEAESRKGPPHVGRPGGPGGGPRAGLVCLAWGGKKRENAAPFPNALGIFRPTGCQLFPKVCTGRREKSMSLSKSQ